MSRLSIIVLIKAIFLDIKAVATLKAVAGTRPLAKVTVVLFKASEVQEQDGELLRQAVSLRVPMRCGANTATAEVWAWQLPDNTAPLLKGVKKSVKLAPAKDTVQMRFWTEQKYIEENSTWRKMKSSTEEAIQAHLKRKLPVESMNMVHEVHHFRHNPLKNLKDGSVNSSIVGLVKVEVDAVPEIVAKVSGARGLASERWWCQPIRYEEKLPDPCKALPKYNWVKKLEEETWSEYADRVQEKCGPLGGYLGDRDLAWRSAWADDDRDNRTKTWNLMKALKRWTAPQVVEICTVAGLADVEVQTRLRGNKTDAWFVKGSHEQGNGFLTVDVDGEDYFIMAVPPHRRVMEGGTSLGNRKVSFAKKEEGQGRRPGPEEEEETAEQSVPEEPSKKMDLDSSADAGAKKRKQSEGGMTSTPPKSKKGRQLPEVPSSLQAVNNAGGGNCGPEALAQGLKDATARPKTGALVRAEIVALMRKERERFLAWWDGQKPQEEVAVCGTFDEYLGLLSKSSAWIGGLELSAAACKYNRPILVYAMEGMKYVFGGAGTYSPIALEYDGRHYRYLRGVIPPENLEGAEGGQCKGMRGGTGMAPDDSESCCTNMALQGEGAAEGEGSTAATGREQSPSEVTNMKLLDGEESHSGSTNMGLLPFEPSACESRTAAETGPRELDAGSLQAGRQYEERCKELEDIIAAQEQDPAQTCTIRRGKPGKKPVIRQFW